MSLAEFVGLVFVYNLVGLGNGPVMLPLLRHGLVEERQALTVQQLLYAFAVAQVTPGQVNLHVASAGFLLFGLGGALLAVVAMSVPGYLMVPLLRGYERIRAAPAVRGLTRGATAASVGLILAATVQMGREALTGPAAWAVFLLTLALAQLLRWHALLCVAAAAAAGLLLVTLP
jgi:chromate transporter